MPFVRLVWLHFKIATSNIRICSKNRLWLGNSFNWFLGDQTCAVLCLELGDPGSGLALPFLAVCVAQVTRCL